MASCGSVSAAARSVGMSRESAYALRRRAGARAFAQAWDAARLLAAEHLVDLAWDRASQGVLRPVYYHGELMGEVRHYDNRLLLGLIAQNRGILEAQGLVTAPAVLAAVAGDWEAALDRAERGEALPEPGAALAVAEAPAADPGEEIEPPLPVEIDRDGEEQSEAQTLSVGLYHHWWDEDGERWLTNWAADDDFAGEELWIDGEGAVLGPYDPDAPDTGKYGPITREYARTLTAEEQAGLDAAEERAALQRERRLELYRRANFGLASAAERASLVLANGGSDGFAGAG